MMRFGRFLALAVMMVSVLPATCLADSSPVKGSEPVAESVLLQWLAPFQRVQVIRGTFEQSRTLKLFTRPFVSTGDFLSVRDKGLLWHTLTPAPSKMIMTPGQLLQETNGRRQTFKATGTGYDGLAILMPALLDGHLDELKRYFTLQGEGTEKDWQLLLVPHRNDLKTMISEVRVSSQQGKLREIALHSAQGDLTEVRFLTFSMSTHTPEQKDLAAFE